MSETSTEMRLSNAEYAKVLSDTWRLRCPNGHTHGSWTFNPGYDGGGRRGSSTAQARFRCDTCARDDNDPYFDVPIDAKEQPSGKPDTYPF